MVGNLARRNREAVESARERRQEERTVARGKLAALRPQTVLGTPRYEDFDLQEVLDVLYPEIDVEEEN